MKYDTLQTSHAIYRCNDSSLTSCLFSVFFKVTTRIQMIYCTDASRAGALSSLIAGNKLIYVLDPSTLLLVAGATSVGELGRSTGSFYSSVAGVNTDTHIATDTVTVTDTDTDTDTVRVRNRDTNTDTVPKYFTRVFRCVG